MLKDGLVWSLALALLAPIAPAIAGTFTVKGPQGTVTTDSTYTWDNNQLAIERQYGWPGGQTSRTQSVYQGDGQGNYTGTVGTTNRQEQTHTYNVQGQRQRTGTTWHNQGTVTGSQGQQAEFQRQGQCANGQCHGQRTLHFGNGSQRPGPWEGSGQTQNRTWRRSPQ
ncbi:MAG: hypothetical protein ACUVSQ_05255 [Pseudanabaenaceae cyanobacterium]